MSFLEEHSVASLTISRVKGLTLGIDGRSHGQVSVLLSDLDLFLVDPFLELQTGSSSGDQVFQIMLWNIGQMDVLI